MQAAILRAPGERFSIEEVELADPGAGEVLVKIAASGLCHSDLNAIEGNTFAPFPTILGHEAAGVVAEVGPGVTDLAEGDHVVLSILPHCDECARCRAGLPNFCDLAWAQMGTGSLFDGTSRLSTQDGERLGHFLMVSSFAEYAVVPQTGAIRIRDDVPLDRAALLSCAVLTGWGSVLRTAHVEPGASVAVFGCGGVGLNVVQGARLAGAGMIVAVDIRREKLELARRLGATHAIHAGEQNPVHEIKRLTDGGVDYAFEALGLAATIQQAWKSARIRGRVTVVGIPPKGTDIGIDPGHFIEEKTLAGCYLGSAHTAEDVPQLVELYRDGQLQLDEIISERIGLEDLDGGFEHMRAGEGARRILVFDRALA
jgi:Zn-dependent alcohol dehydrogenase